MIFFFLFCLRHIGCISVGLGALKAGNGSQQETEGQLELKIKVVCSSSSQCDSVACLSSRKAEINPGGGARSSGCCS